MAKNDAAFKEHIAKLRKKLNDWVQQNIDLAGDASIVQLTGPRGYSFIIHPSSREDAKGRYQISSIDPDGNPRGHSYADTRDQAIEFVSGKGEWNDVVGGPGEYIVTETRGKMKKNPPSKNDELIAMGKEWLEHAPKRVAPGPPNLVGFYDPLDFVCFKCANRLMDRGVNMNRLGKEPVWKDEYEGEVCDLCDKTIKET